MQAIAGMFLLAKITSTLMEQNPLKSL